MTTSRIETLPGGAMVSSTFKRSRKPAEPAPKKTPVFDFGANDRLGDALEIAKESNVPGARLIVTRSERGWCVLWAMANTSYETLRKGLEALRDGGALDYENRRIICPRAADPAIQL